MRQLARYFEEREGYSSVVREEGFAVYKIDGEYCYLRDIWVDADYRKKGIASDMADDVALIARAARCRFLTGSVDAALPSATASTKVLLAYGMEVIGTLGTGILFRKAL